MGTQDSGVRMMIWVPYKKCDDPSLVWWGHFLGRGISIQTRNGRWQRIIFAGMRHTAVCETLIFSIDKKETTSTKEKRMLIEHKSNSSLDDPLWRTVRYIWLFQILTALRVSENFWMWCQKKGWLHQSTVVSKTCKKPSKRFCEITSQTSHTVFFQKGSCLVARGLCIIIPPPFLQLVSSATAVSPSTAVSAGATLAFWDLSGY